jgi:hypothetical protein
MTSIVRGGRVYFVVAGVVYSTRQAAVEALTSR